jgi:prepilin-type N-terminal cleavage/methylation domain-containing protein
MVILRTSQRGVTLAELLVALGVVGVLAIGAASIAMMASRGSRAASSVLAAGAGTGGVLRAMDEIGSAVRMVEARPECLEWLGVFTSSPDAS